MSLCSFPSSGATWLLRDLPLRGQPPAPRPPACLLSFPQEHPLCPSAAQDPRAARTAVLLWDARHPGGPGTRTPPSQQGPSSSGVRRGASAVCSLANACLRETLGDSGGPRAHPLVFIAPGDSRLTPSLSWHPFLPVEARVWLQPGLLPCTVPIPLEHPRGPRCVLRALGALRLHQTLPAAGVHSCEMPVCARCQSMAAPLLKAGVRPPPPRQPSALCARAPAASLLPRPPVPCISCSACQRGSWRSAPPRPSCPLPRPASHKLSCPLGITLWLQGHRPSFHHLLALPVVSFLRLKSFLCLWGGVRPCSPCGPVPGPAPSSSVQWA